MSNFIDKSPIFSDAQLVDLSEQINELVVTQQQLSAQQQELAEQQAKLQQVIDEHNLLMKVVRLISDIHLGVPVSITTEKTYAAFVHKISNVTPTKEQWKSERSGEYLVSNSNRAGEVQLTLRLNNHPVVASSVITCPNQDIAKKIALDFVASGKFPYLNKLLCEFKEQNKEAQ